MATSVLGDLTDAIPLLDDNGAGAYIKGRNTARDIRAQLLGGLIAKASGADFTTRKGILGAGAYDTSLQLFTACRAFAAGTPDQTITLRAGRIGCDRTGQGVYELALESSTVYAMPAADASNPRIDVVYAIPYDKGVPALADAVHGPKVVCETGTPNSSPVAPSVPADAYPICQVFRRTIGATPSGNAIAQADITDLRKGNSWHGTPRPILPGDSLSDAGGYHGEIRMVTGTNVDATYIAAGRPIVFECYDMVSASWKRLNARKYVGSTKPSGNGSLTTSEQMDMTVTFTAISGHKYSVRTGYGHSTNADGARILWAPRYATGASVTTSGTLIESTRVTRSDTGLNWTFFENEWTAPTSGQYTIGVGVYVFLGGASGTVYGTGSGNGRMLLIEDMDA